MSGLSHAHTIEDQDQHRSKRQRMDPEEACKEDKMDTDASPSPSNHDRQTLNNESQLTQNAESIEPSNERSTTEGGPEESHLASDEMSLESLQKDMGDAFLLCKSSKNLISSVC